MWEGKIRNESGEKSMTKNHLERVRSTSEDTDFCKKIDGESLIGGLSYSLNQFNKKFRFALLHMMKIKVTIITTASSEDSSNDNDVLGIPWAST